MATAHRRPFRSHPILPVDGRGYIVTVISVKGRFFHERREPTWKRAIETAQDFRFEFPRRVILISDWTHIWRLDDIADD